VIGDTFAALALSGTRLVGAVAIGFIGVIAAFHKNSLLSITISYILG
jgi:hypothetical protein